MRIKHVDAHSKQKELKEQLLRFIEFRKIAQSLYGNHAYNKGNLYLSPSSWSFTKKHFDDQGWVWMHVDGQPNDILLSDFDDLFLEVQHVS